ncbi:unnamed protein product [Pleuronectes platessa]|uniref:Uncharacterized protein n=1 Tax=Pleuronectes platessa TaxID=8262 RepID=A0A9N7VH00_PLEPL|nr:unnamed protein product [Pleuronectes platessa]
MSKLKVRVFITVEQCFLPVARKWDLRSAGAAAKLIPRHREAFLALADLHKPVQRLCLQSALEHRGL